MTAFLAESHDELRRRGIYQGVTLVGAAAEAATASGRTSPASPCADYGRRRSTGLLVGQQLRRARPAASRGAGRRAAGPLPAAVTAGTGAALVPWLQDYDLGGVDYGDAEVRAQVDALQAVGVDRFLLWARPSTTRPGLDPQG